MAYFLTCLLYCLIKEDSGKLKSSFELNANHCCIFKLVLTKERLN